MSPYEQAAQVYAAERCARTFEEDEYAHLLTGFVFSTPDYFVMGRPVDPTALPAFILNPWHRFDRTTATCWHVYLCAGNFQKAWGILPWDLPLISFERNNVLRTYNLDSLRRLSVMPLH